MSILESTQYLILGAMVTGGMAMTVAGSRILQSSGGLGSNSPGMPSALLLFMFGNIVFALSAGYLIRDVQSDEWDEVLE